jgi:hypothetical protein
MPNGLRVKYDSVWKRVSRLWIPGACCYAERSSREQGPKHGEVEVYMVRRACVVFADIGGYEDERNAAVEAYKRTLAEEPQSGG